MAEEYNFSHVTEYTLFSFHTYTLAYIMFLSLPSYLETSGKERLHATVAGN